MGSVEEKVAELKKEESHNCASQYTKILADINAMPEQYNKNDIEFILVDSINTANHTNQF